MMRLTRFRITAFGETRRETVTPRRACPRSLGRTCTLKNGSRSARHWRVISRNSGPERRRSAGVKRCGDVIRRSNARGPWRGGRLIPCVRRRCSCVRESREHACASERWVEKFFSWVCLNKDVVLRLQRAGNLLIGRVFVNTNDVKSEIFSLWITRVLRGRLATPVFCRTAGGRRFDLEKMS